MDKDKPRTSLSDGTFFRLFDSRYFYIELDGKPINHFAVDNPVRVLKSGTPLVEKVVRLRLSAVSDTTDYLNSLVRDESPHTLVIKDDNTGVIFLSYSAYIPFAPNYVFDGVGMPMNEYTFACVQGRWNFEL